MFDFYQRRKLRGFLSTPLIRLVLLVVVALLAWSALSRFQIASEMSERREAAEVEVSELRMQKKQLEEKVRYLSDERGIEAEMRRQFDVALPGEKVVVIMDEDDGVLPLATTTSGEDAAAWYEFWR